MTKDDFTIFVGNLSEKVTEEILYELFLQAGPLREVRLPSNSGVRKSYGFVEYKHEISVPYALRLLDGTKMFGRPIKLNSRSQYLHLYQPPPPQRHPARERLGPKVSDDSSLRMIGGGLGRKFSDKSMLPSGPSRKNQKRSDDMQPDKTWAGWSPKEYPSQHEESKGQNRNNLNGNRNRSDQGISRKSYHKTPYYNEKHNNRDKNRHDSHSSQRPRAHRPFTR